jgi:protein-S-isoprenylcysteine O-methyltransferase Ste14
MSLDDDAGLLWREQAVPALQPLPTDELAAQSQQLRHKVGRRNRRETVAAGLVAVVFLAYAWVFPHWLTKLGALLNVAGMGVMLWQLQRRASARPQPESLGASLLQFHRAELARQRDALGSVWRWYVAPVVPGLMLFLCGRQIENGHWQAWPFVITALVMAGVVCINRRAARQLQREIDALDQLTKETP